MTKLVPPRFSPKTLEFLKKAARQKRADWLDRNRKEYEKTVQEPLLHLAQSLKAELAPIAVGYHFPQRGIGRIKRPVHRVQEYGSCYKGYLSYSAARPSESRFDHNPNLFFLINPEDPLDPVLVAGGLYMASSRQVRAIREAIAQDSSAFEKLFVSKEFSQRFPGGFSDEKSSSRIPRGFDPAHPRMNWLRLQAFFVWRPYTRREFAAPLFPALLARDCRQILRLNELLEAAIQGRLPKTAAKDKPSGLSDRLGELRAPQRPMDF